MLSPVVLRVMVSSHSFCGCKSRASYDDAKKDSADQRDIYFQEASDCVDPAPLSRGGNQEESAQYAANAYLETQMRSHSGPKRTELTRSVLIIYC